MKFRVRLSAQARVDIDQLYNLILEREDDIADAERALEALDAGLQTLGDFPYACRKAGEGQDPFLRELIVGFGAAGYVVLYGIDNDAHVTVAAVRHQREDDYH